jgi:hypothetical protein
MPASARIGRARQPENAAMVAISQSKMCDRTSQITSRPGLVCTLIAA